MKLIKDLTDIDVIHCPTEEICLQVGKLINNKSGNSWKIYKEKMCLVGLPKGRWESYYYLDFYIKHKCNIINGQDFINFNTKPKQLNYILW